MRGSYVAGSDRTMSVNRNGYIVCGFLLSWRERIALFLFRWQFSAIMSFVIFAEILRIENSRHFLPGQSLMMIRSPDKDFLFVRNLWCPTFPTFE
jgi:hypothetical protein